MRSRLKLRNKLKLGNLLHMQLSEVIQNLVKSSVAQDSLCKQHCCSKESIVFLPVANIQAKKAKYFSHKQ